MAVIHNTTMNPGKLDLVEGWLPAQPWYLGMSPSLTKAGGFRLDDPDGEVGIEFMVAVAAEATYLVPMTYRSAPLDGADDALIGTSEHGVLGTRYIYDGLHDPVLVAQLVALIQGAARPQAQGESDTPDPTVLSRPVSVGPLKVEGFTVHDASVLTAEVGADTPLTIRLHRVLAAETEPMAAELISGGGVSATWRLANGDRVRGVFATASL
jgi:hypothetical protein